MDDELARLYPDHIADDIAEGPVHLKEFDRETILLNRNSCNLSEKNATSSTNEQSHSK